MKKNRNPKDLREISYLEKALLVTTAVATFLGTSSCAANTQDKSSKTNEANHLVLEANGLNNFTYATKDELNIGDVFCYKSLTVAVPQVVDGNSTDYQLDMLQDNGSCKDSHLDKHEARDIAEQFIG